MFVSANRMSTENGAVEVYGQANVVGAFLLCAGSLLI
jgi:hypothetical protein